MDVQTHRLPNLVLKNMQFRVPLDHNKPGGDQINIFARAAVAPGCEDRELPWLVFFQGGPGFPALRPESNSGWLKRALQDYRVLLLDQRGTGQSTPLTTQTLVRLGTAREQADYVKFFRADSIVRDAELIRRQLAGESGHWSVLGQSFGGFCVTRYLSAAPESLQEAIITGGLPPIHHTPDDIYRALYPRVAGRNREYYARYPDDIERAQQIAAYLAGHEVRLPAGGWLTPRRFQQLGINFGMSDGFEKVHYLLEGAFVEGSQGRELSYGFLRGFENAFAFETNPIYALLHEAEYCQGTASRWSAERVRREYPEFDWAPGRQVFFTGEMVYPWMFEDHEQLRPLREAAEILADYEAWSPLYNQGVLNANRVPVAAAVYYNDMYVERTFSEETAAQVQGIKLWVTNEYEHNGLRADGERILDQLLGFVRGEK